MNKRELGNEKEDRAAEYLQQQGYEVIERNYHCGFAEIDIIAKEKDEIQGDYLCFVEVKYRSGDKFDAPEGVVSFSKQRKICQGVRFYMKEKRLSLDTPVRFDVIFVLGDEIRLIKNAFEYIR